MDRQAFTTGQLVPNSQLLGMEKGKLVALGYALESVMGAGGTVVSGLACAPTTVPSLSVVVGRGSIMTTAAIDPTTAYSDLGTDTNATIKQGILQEPGVTLTLTPPSTAGYSQVYLIQATQSDSDTSTTVPFYNASNPAVPYNGPSNSGNATLTLRQSKCIVSLKAGAAASTGSQTAPSADTGNVGLYTITLVNGQSTITAGQIVKLASAPFVPDALPAIPGAIQNNKYVYVRDTGSVNALAVAPAPALASYAEGQELIVVPANTNTSSSVTLAASGLAAAPVLLSGGGQPAAGDLIVGRGQRLRQDSGGNWRFAGPAPSELGTSQALAAHNVVGFNRVNFTTAGTSTWTVPAGIYAVYAEVWGGGGGGSGNNNAAGASGGYSAGAFAVTPGQAITITVGAGGTGTTGSSNGSGNYGGNGGTSSFGSFCSATGGTGGQAGPTSGGSGTGGSINISGTQGQDLDGTNCYAFGGGAPRGGGAPTAIGANFPGGGGAASGTANGVNAGVGIVGYNGSQGAVFIQY